MNHSNEQKALASILADPELFGECGLEHTHFERENHRKIFRAMAKVYDSGGSPGVLEVLGHLHDQGSGELEPEVKRLNGILPSAVGADRHFQAVKDSAESRRIREGLVAISGNMESLSPDELRSRLSKLVEGSRTSAQAHRSKRLVDLFKPIGERSGWLTEEPLPARALLRLGEDLWCPMGKTGGLVATGGTGKSQALIQLAIAVATGKKWLDTFTVERPGPVVLGLAEEGEDDIRRRIYHAVKAMRLNDSQRKDLERNLFPLPLAGRTNALMDNDGPTGKTVEWERLLEKAPAGPWSLVTIDPASRFMGPNSEKDNAAATQFIEILESWAQAKHGGAEVGPMVLFAHHTSKGKDWKESLYSQEVIRGSSAFTDGARWQANMVAIEGNTEEIVGLKVTKSNDGPRGGEFWLRRGREGVLEIEEREEVYKRIQREHEEKAKEGKKNGGGSKSQATDAAESAAYRALQDGKRRI
jgi:hypothetical protein